MGKLWQHPHVNMSEKSEDKKGLDLSALDFGPSWARGGEAKPKRSFNDGENRGGDSRGPARGRGRTDRGGERKDFRGGDRRDSRGGGGRQDGRNDRNDRRGGGGRPPRQAPTPAPEGVVAEIMPIEAGVDNMAKEIAAAGRTYSVFELAYVVMGARERFHMVFRKPEDQKDLFQCKKDEAVYLTKAECMAHFHQAEWLGELYKEEEVEGEAPAGNFQAVAKCGISGVVFGPPNYHAYQTGILEMHRTRFSHMDLERYKANIETERSEEAVEAWKESMKKKVQWRPIGDDETVLEDRAALEKHFVEKHFEEVFHATHRVHVPSAIPAKMLSPGLLTLLKDTIADQRRYPGALASFLCRQLSGRHLAVFKWRGKLHCGPSRPHVIPVETKIADRPQAMLTWITANPGGGVDALWKAVFPESIEEDAKKEWYHDLHWLLNQGFAALMSDGHLYDSEQSKGKPKKGKKSPKVAADKAVAKVEKAVTEAVSDAPAEETAAEAEVKSVEVTEDVAVKAADEVVAEVSPVEEVAEVKAEDSAEVEKPTADVVEEAEPKTEG